MSENKYFRSTGTDVDYKKFVKQKDAASKEFKKITANSTEAKINADVSYSETETTRDLNKTKEFSATSFESEAEVDPNAVLQQELLITGNKGVKLQTRMARALENKKFEIASLDYQNQHLTILKEMSTDIKELVASTKASVKAIQKASEDQGKKISELAITMLNGDVVGSLKAVGKGYLKKADNLGLIDMATSMYDVFKSILDSGDLAQQVRETIQDSIVVNAAKTAFGMTSQTAKFFKDLAADNPGEALTMFINSAALGENRAQRAILDGVAQHTRVEKLKSIADRNRKKSKEDLGEKALFDKRTYDTWNNVIPQTLAEINAGIRALGGGDGEVVRYHHEEGKWLFASDIKSLMKQESGKTTGEFLHGQKKEVKDIIMDDALSNDMLKGLASQGLLKNFKLGIDGKIVDISPIFEKYLGPVLKAVFDSSKCPTLEIFYGSDPFVVWDFLGLNNIIPAKDKEIVIELIKTLQVAARVDLGKFVNLGKEHKAFVESKNNMEFTSAEYIQGPSHVIFGNNKGGKGGKKRGGGNNNNKQPTFESYAKDTSKSKSAMFGNALQDIESEHNTESNEAIKFEENFISKKTGDDEALSEIENAAVLRDVKGVGKEIKDKRAALSVAENMYNKFHEMDLTVNSKYNACKGQFSLEQIKATGLPNSPIDLLKFIKVTNNIPDFKMEEFNESLNFNTIPIDKYEDLVSFNRAHGSSDRKDIKLDIMNVNKNVKDIVAGLFKDPAMTKKLGIGSGVAAGYAINKLLADNNIINSPMFGHVLGAVGGAFGSMEKYQNMLSNSFGTDADIKNANGATNREIMMAKLMKTVVPLTVGGAAGSSVFKFMSSLGPLGTAIGIPASIATALIGGGTAHYMKQKIDKELANNKDDKDNKWVKAGKFLSNLPIVGKMFGLDYLRKPSRVYGDELAAYIASVETIKNGLENDDDKKAITEYLNEGYKIKTAFDEAGEGTPKLQNTIDRMGKFVKGTSDLLDGLKNTEDNTKLKADLQKNASKALSRAEVKIAENKKAREEAKVLADMEITDHNKVLDVDDETAAKRLENFNKNKKEGMKILDSHDALDEYLKDIEENIKEINEKSAENLKENDIGTVIQQNVSDDALDKISKAETTKEKIKLLREGGVTDKDVITGIIKHQNYAIKKEQKMKEVSEYIIANLKAQGMEDKDIQRVVSSAMNKLNKDEGFIKKAAKGIVPGIMDSIKQSTFGSMVFDDRSTSAQKENALNMVNNAMGIKGVKQLVSDDELKQIEQDLKDIEVAEAKAAQEKADKEKVEKDKEEAIANGKYVEPAKDDSTKGVIKPVVEVPKTEEKKEDLSGGASASFQTFKKPLGKRTRSNNFQPTKKKELKGVSSKHKLDINGCGIAATATALSHLGLDVSAKTLSVIAEPYFSKNGLHIDFFRELEKREIGCIFNIYTVSKNLGYFSTVIGPLNTKSKFHKNNNIIALVDNPETNERHYVNILSYDESKDELTISDPDSPENVTYSKRADVALYTISLVLVNGSNIKRDLKHIQKINDKIARMAIEAAERSDKGFKGIDKNSASDDFDNSVGELMSSKKSSFFSKLKDITKFRMNTIAPSTVPVTNTENSSIESHKVIDMTPAIPDNKDGIDKGSMAIVNTLKGMLPMLITDAGVGRDAIETISKIDLEDGKSNKTFLRKFFNRLGIKKEQKQAEEVNKSIIQTAENTKPIEGKKVEEKKPEEQEQGGGLFDSLLNILSLFGLNPKGLLGKLGKGAKFLGKAGVAGGAMLGAGYMGYKGIKAMTSDSWNKAKLGIKSLGNSEDQSATGKVTHITDSTRDIYKNFQFGTTALKGAKELGKFGFNVAKNGVGKAVGLGKGVVETVSKSDKLIDKFIGTITKSGDKLLEIIMSFKEKCPSIIQKGFDFIIKPEKIKKMTKWFGDILKKASGLIKKVAGEGKLMKKFIPFAGLVIAGTTAFEAFFNAHKYYGVEKSNCSFMDKVSIAFWKFIYYAVPDIIAKATSVTATIALGPAGAIVGAIIFGLQMYLETKYSFKDFITDIGLVAEKNKEVAIEDKNQQKEANESKKDIDKMAKDSATEDKNEKNKVGTGIVKVTYDEKTKAAEEEKAEKKQQQSAAVGPTPAPPAEKKSIFAKLFGGSSSSSTPTQSTPSTPVAPTKPVTTDSGSGDASKKSEEGGKGVAGPKTKPVLDSNIKAEPVVIGEKWSKKAFTHQTPRGIDPTMKALVEPYTGLQYSQGGKGDRVPRHLPTYDQLAEKGKAPFGSDCSEFARGIYRNLGFSSPGAWTGEQQMSGQKIDIKNGEPIAPGDLIFFDNTKTNARNPDHVGVYAGNNWYAHTAANDFNKANPAPNKDGEVPRGIEWGNLADNAKSMVQFGVRPNVKEVTKNAVDVPAGGGKPVEGAPADIETDKKIAEAGAGKDEPVVEDKKVTVNTKKVAGEGNNNKSVKVNMKGVGGIGSGLLGTLTQGMDGVVGNVVKSVTGAPKAVTDKAVSTGNNMVSQASNGIMSSVKSGVRNVISDAKSDAKFTIGDEEYDMHDASREGGIVRDVLRNKLDIESNDDLRNKSFKIGDYEVNYGSKIDSAITSAKRNAANTMIDNVSKTAGAAGTGMLNSVKNAVTPDFLKSPEQKAAATPTPTASSASNKPVAGQQAAPPVINTPTPPASDPALVQEVSRLNSTMSLLASALQKSGLLKEISIR